MDWVGLDWVRPRLDCIPYHYDAQHVSVTDGQTDEKTTVPYPLPCTIFTLRTPSMCILLHVHVDPHFVFTLTYIFHAVNVIRMLGSVTLPVT